MIQMIRRIIEDTLQALYQPLIFALAVAVLLLLVYMYIDKYNEGSFKEKVFTTAGELKKMFLESVKYRRLFYLFIFVVLFLFKTLLNRKLWINPVKDVIGVWGFYKKDGTFTTEIVENTVVFIPLIFFLLFFLETTSKKSILLLSVIRRAIVVSFLSSFTIEMLQLFLRLGTWELSDLFFNTLGGMIGGLLYWVFAKLRKI